jgi:hypothetical protein
VELRAPIFISSALACACNLTDPFDSPNIPDDFPQLGDFDDGRAELVVDGEMVTTKEGGGTFYDPGGLEPAALPASVSFDYSLYLDFVAPDEGTYEAADSELTAEWDEFELDTECGQGTLTIVGKKSFDDILDREAIWGTLQRELCARDYDGPTAGRLEISGRFSSVVSEI